MNIPFHRPFLPKDTNKLFQDSIKNGWLTSGPVVKEFESKLSQYLDVDYVVALSSGTASLHLTLAALGLTKDDKFIAPTYTFVATAEVGEYLGSTPVLIDSDYDTFNIDLNKVEDSLKNDNKIKAILPVHFGGQSVDMESLLNLSEKFGVFVLEDAAHALETISNIGKTGVTNNACAFSFYSNKNMTTGGEGGAFTTNDKLLAEKVRKLSLHGMSRDGWNRFKMGSKWSYDISMLGYKYNMTDISASFGLDQLKKVDSWHSKRLDIVEKYNHGLNEIDGIDIPKHYEGILHAWRLYVIKINPEYWIINRDEIIREINKNGVGTSVHYIPIHMHSYYIKKYNFKATDFPVAKDLSERAISLPIYPLLNEESISYIIKVLNNIWNKFKK